MAFLIPIAFFILGLLILYLLIQAAIDGSKTAAEIRQIRIILQKQLDFRKQGNSCKTGQPDGIKECEVIDTPYDTCPACGAPASQEDTECKSCGLNLQ
ncbi:MAG TPA: zinc ribbon domain-containing protein [Ruminiclostridium sp.]|nr:zinc ribbon domain-containing protein [Ruminiclostridium sp.]